MTTNHSYEYQDYKIETTKAYSLKEIKPIGKGSVPLELRGVYTSPLEAEKAIDRYVASKEQKGKRSGKQQSTD